MLTETIRSNFLKYFKSKGHSVISSSPVIPHEDPTLLFVNAGMNQFKDVFLGSALRDYKRASTSQKCVRVGGKHNDLENVGHTSRHLTFFEMLGNFSFGDYFKKEAIQFAWEVSTQVFGFEPDRIWPTVYKDDDEAFELWKAYVPESRITRFGEKENFWAMGETGPCGPCSELLYDRGPAFGPAKNPSEDATGERYLEFWNLVFMQFNRGADGKMVPLPKPSIDTGAGIERVVSLKMGVDSVFETDVLRSLIAKVEEISGKTYSPNDAALSPAFRVIADHLRTLAFAIADGAQPSNLDRGYVLRKVLRRAVRYGRQLGLDEPFLAKVLPRLIETMGKDYPEIVKAKGRIEEIVTAEEEAFLRTLKRGGALLNQIIERGKHSGQISGEDAFKLKDTYGLPFEEIALLAKDSNLTVDEQKFLELEQQAKERSRASQKGVQQLAQENIFEQFVHDQGPTVFLGYTEISSEGKVLALVKEGAFADHLSEGEEGLVVLDQTPFYAEMGGQVGDKGVLQGTGFQAEVLDCVAPIKGVIAHRVKVKQGSLSRGAKVSAHVDGARRLSIANNHTATHLLHWALQQVLGEHIKQAGSVVDEERLRFDFSHHKALSPEEIRRIEDIVNAKIRENHSVRFYEIPYDEAKERSDIKQFFGEKYGAKVRVVESGEAKELCGGTHTSATGNIGYFRIAKESSIAAGVRRIEAETGHAAEMVSRVPLDELETLSRLLKVPAGKVMERVEKLCEENRLLSQELKGHRQAALSTLLEQFFVQRETVRNTALIARETSLGAEELRSLGDMLADKLDSGIVLLASGTEGKAQLYLRLSDDLVKKGLQAGAIIRELAPLIDGSGGGKPQSAMAGGKSVEKIPLALLKVRDYVP